jgi:hypothetical protein
MFKMMPAKPVKQEETDDQSQIIRHPGSQAMIGLFPGV